MDEKTERVPHAHSTERGRRLLLLPLVPVVLGAIAGVAGLELIPANTQDIGPAVVSASAGIGPPRTVVRVPPFGSISARTHSAPLEIDLWIDEVDPAAIGQALRSRSSRERLAGQVMTGLEGGARGLALRALIGAGLFGSVAGVLLPGRRLWWAAAGAAGGLLAAGVLFGLTGRQFEVEAFGEPRFSGPVERAPQIIRAVQRGAGSIEGLRSRVSEGASRLSQVLALAGQPIVDPHRGTVAILHISDLHSNPLGLELAQELATNFQVDAIVDTGDITSFGEPIEGRIAGLIPGIPVPYLVVPGNHDSEGNRTTLARTPNVTMLHDTVADIKGVKIMGWADPAFTAKNGISQKEADRLQRRDASLVAARVSELRPDVLAVHNPLLAGETTGKVPLVLAGHRHRQGKIQEDETLLLEVGSTGATGLGSFVVEADQDYEARVIYFRNSRAVAFDYIRLRAFGADFEVERQTLAPSASDEAGD